MNPDPDFHDEFAGLETQLSAWMPVPSTGRDKMLYQAGANSAVRDVRLRAVLATSVALTLISCGLLAREHNDRLRVEALLAAHPVSEPRISVVPTAPLLATTAPDPNSYLALTRHILATGDDVPPPLPYAPRDPGPQKPPEPPLTPLQARNFDPMSG